MDNSTALLLVFATVGALIWMAAAVRRIYRLARYFQLEGYNSPRFLRWMLRQRREQRYVLATLAALVLWIVPALIDSKIFVFAALLLLIFQPRDKQINQPFTRTQRAMRLLVTAFAVALILPLVLLVHLLTLASQGFNDLAYVAFWGALTGAVSLLITAVALPLANLLMWPVEESFRRYYLRMAKNNLKRSGAKVIVITGSYGKTSTKHYLQHLLSARYRTLMTPKSYNTLMGISRVINDILAGDASYEYFIVEADAYFVGENARICKLVEPQIGMVMTVGPMHLERLGSMANIATAQYEIIASLPQNGVGIFNGDDPQVRAMLDRHYPQTRLMVTQHEVSGARLSASHVQMLADGLHFDLKDSQTGAQQALYAPLYGETNVTNILMAAVVALHLGLSLEEIAARAATLEPAEHRLVRRVLPNGTVVIDDAYSANPVGTKAALEVLSLHTQSRHRVVISSGMFELGSAQEQENYQLGQRIAAAATDVILIGVQQVAPVKAGLLAAKFPVDRLHVVETLNEAMALYPTILGPGDTLLVLTDLPDSYAS
jgi:UDP-N-acetylmuramoyl-tripeptide--D-alanyl-D-alanine ligase